VRTSSQLRYHDDSGKGESKERSGRKGRRE